MGRRHACCAISLPLRHLLLGQRDFPVQGEQAWQKREGEGEETMGYEAGLREARQSF